MCLSRILPPQVDAVVDLASWGRPAIFDEIQRRGDIPGPEMASVFNVGVGMILAVDPNDVDATLDSRSSYPYGSHVVGQIIAGTGQVHLAGL